MTRENKLALVIGFGLMLFVGILVSDHFSAQRFDPATVAEAQPKTTETEPVQLDAVGGDALVDGRVNLGLEGTGTPPDFFGCALDAHGNPVPFVPQELPI